MRCKTNSAVHTFLPFLRFFSLSFLSLPFLSLLLPLLPVSSLRFRPFLSLLLPLLAVSSLIFASLPSLLPALTQRFCRYNIEVPDLEVPIQYHITSAFPPSLTPGRDVSLLQLPSDILQMIAGHVVASSLSSLASLARTCKRFHEATKNHSAMLAAWIRARKSRIEEVFLLFLSSLLPFCSLTLPFSKYSFFVFLFTSLFLSLPFPFLPLITSPGSASIREQLYGLCTPAPISLRWKRNSSSCSASGSRSRSSASSPASFPCRRRSCEVSRSSLLRSRGMHR